MPGMNEYTGSFKFNSFNAHVFFGRAMLLQTLRPYSVGN